jgi:hypothetical protein
MSNRQKMNYVLRSIKRINNPIVADTQTKAITASQMVMREGVEAEPHFVNFAFNPIANIFWESKKGGIEASVKDLERRTHANSRFAGPRTNTRAHLPFGFANIRFKFRFEFQVVFKQIIEPVAYFTQLIRREFFQIAFDLLNFAHI